MYVIAAANILPGRFGELTEASETAALGIARQLSAEHRRVAFDVAEIRGDGAYVFAVFLNGQRRFTAAA